VEQAEATVERRSRSDGRERQQANPYPGRIQLCASAGNQQKAARAPLETMTYDGSHRFERLPAIAAI